MQINLNRQTFKTILENLLELSIESVQAIADGEIDSHEKATLMRSLIFKMGDIGGVLLTVPDRMPREEINEAVATKNRMLIGATNLDALVAKHSEILKSFQKFK
jgi:hypothetical protein